MSDSHQAFWCHHRDGYSVIAFPKELATAHMAEVREAGVKVIDQLSAVKAPACLVDLTALDYMGSSLVASIVRIWKAVKDKDGRMVVVASNERITEVLKATGLTKVWTVVSTFESGVHALGYSPEAKVEKRERRLLAFVGPVSLVGGMVAVAIRMLPRLASIKQPPDWMVYTIIGLAAVASGIYTFRETGIRRALSILGLLLSIPLLALFIWHAEIRIPLPKTESVSGGNTVIALPLDGVTKESTGNEESPTDDGDSSIDDADQKEKGARSLSLGAMRGGQEGDSAAASAVDESPTGEKAPASPPPAKSGNSEASTETRPSNGDAGAANSPSRPNLKFDDPRPGGSANEGSPAKPDAPKDSVGQGSTSSVGSPDTPVE